MSTYGLVGSNGGFVATGTIPSLRQNPVDKLIIVDGRAYIDQTIKTVDAMKGNVVLINTGGDASSFSDMIANHNGAKKVKSARPATTLLYVDPKGWNIPGTAHLAAFQRDKEMWVKRYTKDGYSDKSRMTGSELISNLISGERIPSKHGGVYIKPQFESDGKGGNEIKDKILKSRSSDNALTWEVDK